MLWYQMLSSSVCAPLLSMSLCLYIGWETAIVWRIRISRCLTSLAHIPLHYLFLCMHLFIHIPIHTYIEGKKERAESKKERAESKKERSRLNYSKRDLML